MTLRIKDIEVPVSPNDADGVVREAVAKKLGLEASQILQIQIRKKSLDARRKSRIVYHYQVDVNVEDEAGVLSASSDAVEIAPVQTSADPLAGLEMSGKRLRTPPVIVGSGPAGVFAALVLARAGQRSVIIERGEPVEKRLKTVNRLRRDGGFSDESNYCFGEGGAGTFSDGKLTCGRNHPLVRFLFEQWVEFGAPPEILYDAHPHIGTDYLLKIAVAQRQFLTDTGTEFMFGRRFVDFDYDPCGSPRYRVRLDDGSTIDTDQLVVAVGHSARDTYRMLVAKGLAIQPKPFAIGARFEHPQEMIDKIQFGNCKLLPPAEYKLVAHSGQRGIWTFCMCPGGHLLPTGAQAGHLAINGMSYHARNSGFANAAVVVNVLREDFFRGDVLDGMHWQADLEKAAFQAGGGNYAAPAQRLVDFLAGRDSRGEMQTTYKPGIAAARLDRVLPEFVVDALKGAVVEYNKKMHGFLGKEALVVGVESKTSSPIVMMRDKELQSTSHRGIFPCGEGAGFAGGIVSAALDGVRIGRAVLDDAVAQGYMMTLQ